mmetsp:Transcript_43893/g.99198  ORF Transcript_43893/g.99198 Transcript_43893/m.99198 type:complete len:210 (+) Transcript_43893:72-701(+)
MACGNYQLDMTAAAFGQCKCGHPKTSHKVDTSAGKPRRSAGRLVSPKFQASSGLSAAPRTPDSVGAATGGSSPAPPSGGIADRMAKLSVSGGIPNPGLASSANRAFMSPMGIPSGGRAVRDAGRREGAETDGASNPADESPTNLEHGPLLQRASTTSSARKRPPSRGRYSFSTPRDEDSGLIGISSASSKKIVLVPQSPNKPTTPNPGS